MADEADDKNVGEPTLAIIKKREIFEQVASKTGQRKRDVRVAVEATLEFLHEVLADGKEVQAPPLGRIRVQRQKVGTPAEKMVYKLLLKKTDAAADDAIESDETVLAEAAE